jgi:hypothetical protein
MKYEIDIVVEDLGIITEDLISLAEDNGDMLYDQDELDYRIEEALADANDDLKETINTMIAEIADLKRKSVDAERIAQFVQVSMRVDALAIAEGIRTGDYGA